MYLLSFIYFHCSFDIQPLISEMMKYKTTIILTIIFIGQLWTAIAINHEAIALAFTIASNQFGLDLLQRLSMKNDVQNIYFSPFILEKSLSMIYAATDGNTKYQLENVLHLYELPYIDDVDGIIDAIRTICSRMNETNVLWNFLNLMVINSNIDFNPNYTTLVEENFQGKIVKINDMKDFTNQFVEQFIHDKLLPQTFNLTAINDDDGGSGGRQAIALISLATFRAKWLDPFDKRQTRIGFFHGSNGEKYSNVQYMFKDGPFPHLYLPDMDADMIMIKFFDDKLAFIGIVPRLIEMNLNRIHRSLSSLYLYYLIAKLNKTSATEFGLFLPRMDIEGTYENLSADLQTMGIEDLFNPYCSNLTIGLFDNKTNNDESTASSMWIDHVYHQSRIILDEYGVGNQEFDLNSKINQINCESIKFKLEIFWKL